MMIARTFINATKYLRSFAFQKLKEQMIARDFPQRYKIPSLFCPMPYALCPLPSKAH
jgi:hypothetical protein